MFAAQTYVSVFCENFNLNARVLFQFTSKSLFFFYNEMLPTISTKRLTHIVSTQLQNIFTAPRRQDVQFDSLHIDYERDLNNIAI